MRKTLAISLTALLGLFGCTQPRQAMRQQPPRPILVDEYSVLDDQQSDKPLNDRALQRKLEEARHHYLLAMKSSEQGHASLAARHFESAIQILNALMTYPGVSSSPEYTRLSESVIRDYEEQITSLDSMDVNSSFFVLRDKIFQEIETIPVERKSYPSKTRGANATGGQVAQSDLEIELTDNTPVQQCIAYFTSERGRRFFTRWLERSGRFFSLYDKILAEEGAPNELKYLSMIESGLDPSAVSWAKAVGLWQFIPATGQQYGLTINYWVDERRDPEKATRAAARYLKDLYADLGDWQLALASYNCGPGRLKSAIAKASSRDYWHVRQYLPRETQQYVPLYIAAAKIAMDPEAYGFTNINYETPDDYESILLKNSYDFSALAEAAKTSVDDLKELNPEILHSRIPLGVNEYTLRVPAGAPRDLSERIEKLPTPEETKLSWVTHKIRKGESLTEIASKYNVPVADIYSANKMTPKSPVHRGALLRIPVLSTRDGNDSSSDLAANDTDAQPVTSSEPSKVTSAPTRDVAQPVAAASQPATTATAVASAPAVKGQPDRPAVRESKPAANQQVAAVVHKSTPSVKFDKADKQIALRTREVPSRKNRNAVTTTTTRFESHKVRRGESLTEIADRYGVSVSDLKAWNRDDVRGQKVMAGAKLKIYGEAPSKGDSRRSSRASRSSVPKQYKVRRGETLADIANKFGVSVSELRKNNKVKEKDLKAGQVLRLQR